MSSTIRDFKYSGSWRVLEKVAAEIVRSLEKRTGLEMAPLLGGGTRLMLTYEHRISHDIDLFIRDPQWIPYLSPRLQDEYPGCQGYEEASNYLKLNYRQGEIDFIVAPRLTNLKPESSSETSFLLDPICEVIKKKLLYRGASLHPRDIYDWWTVSTVTPDVLPSEEVRNFLGEKARDVALCIGAMKKSPIGLRLWDNLQKSASLGFVEALAWAENQLIVPELGVAPAKPGLSGIKEHGKQIKLDRPTVGDRPGGETPTAT